MRGLGLNPNKRLWVRYFGCVATYLPGQKRVMNFDAVAQFVPSVDGVTPAATEFQIDFDRHLECDGFAPQLGHAFRLLG